MAIVHRSGSLHSLKFDRRSRNLIGEKFGRLTVFGFAGFDKRGQRIWNCRCADGNEVLVTSGSLISGNTASCGCLKIDRTKESRTTHGLSTSRDYFVWHGMLRRCTDPKCKNFAEYGARGITVCDRWLDFENFIADMGRKLPGMTLDRVDNSSGYSPDNCQWVTRAVQNRNKRTNRLVTHNGETLTISQWAERSGINQRTLLRRLNRGTPIALALSVPRADKATGKQTRFTTPEYRAWMSIKRRCYNTNSEDYPTYGRKGVVMCERWLQSFCNFLADIGPRPSKIHSLDRIDVNGNYEPGNCRWATAKQQARNTSRTRWIEFQGERLSLAEWAERFHVPAYVISQRLNRGWDIGRAITEVSLTRR